MCCRRYEIFTPVENLIFHHYEREKGKSVYSDHDEAWWDEEQRTLVRALDAKGPCVRLQSCKPQRSRPRAAAAQYLTAAFIQRLSEPSVPVFLPTR